MLNLIQNIKRLGAVKGPRFQSKEYLDYLHTLGCAVMGCNDPATVDHLIHGRRTLSSDLLALNLCLRHHMSRQSGGTETDSQFRKETWDFLIIENIQNFLTLKGLATRYKQDHKRTNRGTAKKRKSHRKNRQAFTKPFIPLTDRGL